MHKNHLSGSTLYNKQEEALIENIHHLNYYILQTLDIIYALTELNISINGSPATRHHKKSVL